MASKTDICHSVRRVPRFRGRLRYVPIFQLPPSTELVFTCAEYEQPSEPRIVNKDLDWIPASHESPESPSVWKKVLLKKADLLEGRVQMLNVVSDRARKSLSGPLPRGYGRGLPYFEGAS